MLDIVRQRRSKHVCTSIGRGSFKISVPTPTVRTALGGSVKETNTATVLNAEIEGHPITTHALVIDEIGKDENGTPIEILFGALAMQQWGIPLIPDEERLDLSHYPQEFVEF